MKESYSRGFAHVGLIALIVLVLAIVVGAGWYVYNSHDKTVPENTSKIERSKGRSVTGSDAASFFDNLSACNPAKLQFEHPLTGDKLYKYVKGMAAEKCEYQEEMPNNGNITCLYTESERKVIAQYYRDSTAGKLGVESTDTVDGKFVYTNSAGITYEFGNVMTANPVSTAIEMGICKTSGY